MQTEDDVSFERLIYEGIIQLSTVQHESIIISNYNGADVELHGGKFSISFNLITVYLIACFGP